MVIAFETVAPFAGDVSEVEMPVLPIVSVTGMVCGEPDAFGSEIVAVALCVPRDNVAGFAMNATLVLATPASELDSGLNVSHVCVLEADQLRVVLAAAEFVIMIDCEEVAVLPCAAEKFKEVEVATER